MRKLNQRKIRWIVKEMEKGELSMHQIAKQQDISIFHAWRLYHRYRGVKRPKLLPCGRKPKPITGEEMTLVKRKHEETFAGAVSLEKILSEEGIRMPHNRIHRILRMSGLAQEQPKKSKRRKWIRYERKHSNSLWHADWFEHKCKQYLLYEDDASRFVPGGGEFDNATSQNSIVVFDAAVERWGLPRQLITDHGIQFYSDEEKDFVFRDHVQAKGSEHIMARVKHPQTNGKLERLVRTIKYLMGKGLTFDEAMRFYNEKRPHMSLENGRLGTPIQAFYDKLPR